MNIILGGTHGLGEQIARTLQAGDEETFVIGRGYDASVHGAGMAIDLSKEEDVEKLVDYMHDLGDKALKSFYWVAGYGYNGQFADQHDPGVMVDVNLSHVIPVAQAVWQKQRDAHDGNFIVVSSTTGERPRKDEAVYAATKYGQVGFAKSLGMESQEYGLGIKVALFMPGGMQTPFWHKNPPENYSEFLDSTKVAQYIVERVREQRDTLYSETIERGSL